MSKRDGIIISGLVLMGAGLFFWFGLGPALTVPGAVLAFMGVAIRDRSGRRGLG